MTTLTVNGRSVIAEIPARTHLADFLRETLLLTGTHLGCEHGVCGACTVLLDGEPVRACLTYAALCDGADIRTVEGLAEDPVTARLRAAFSAEHALQCGYCTPGMLVTARDIVTRLRDTDDDRIRLELTGNLCRCTGYNGIVRAIRLVLDEGLAVPAPAASPVPAARFGSAAVEQPEPAPAGNAGLQQHLRFPVPANTLWAALRDPALIAACIPGAVLDRVEGERIAGAMQVALGPVRVRFAGEATLAYDDTVRRGTVAGEGAERGGTRVNATARFRVEPEGDAASALHIEIEYALRGALAQLAPGRIVEMLAGELEAMFGRSLAERLAGRTSEAAPLRAGALGWRMIVLWLRPRLFGK